jgi:hypothetical protein
MRLLASDKQDDASSEKVGNMAVSEGEKWVTGFLGITVEEWREMSPEEAMLLLVGEDQS